MSKRDIFSQPFRENKRPKLENNNLPPNELDSENKTWGDESEDEILLIASQVCEESYANSTLPEYSVCMQPRSTSTQLYQPKNENGNNFQFKVPTPINARPESTISDYFSSKKQNNINESKGKPLEELQLRICYLQEENSKLKSEMSNLRNKFITKDGETKILRDKLSSHQKSVDNLKLEQVFAQEGLKKEFYEKLSTVNSELENLKAELDSKSLEVMKLKNKRALDSSNVKVTHVTHSPNEVIPRHLFRRSESKKNVNNSGCQTDCKSDILRLNKPLQIEHNNLVKILPLIMENRADEQWNLLNQNEKLQKPMDFAFSKCRIFNTVHRLPMTTVASHKVKKPKMTLTRLGQDLAYIVEKKQDLLSEDIQMKYINIFNQIKLVLSDVLVQLQAIAKGMTVAFQKESDRTYIDATSKFVVIERRELLQAKAVHEDEQAVLSRRVTAVLSYILESSSVRNFFFRLEEKSSLNSNELCRVQLLDLFYKICDLIDTCSCAVLYSGQLISVVLVMEHMWEFSSEAYQKVIKIIKSIIISRPMYTVLHYILSLVRVMSIPRDVVKSICDGNTTSKLRLDNEQGVLSFKRDTCVLQLLFKQSECCLKCLARQELVNEMVAMIQCLISIYSNNVWKNENDNKCRCDCSLVIRQLLVYALNLCATVLKQHQVLSSMKEYVMYSHSEREIEILRFIQAILVTIQSSERRPLACSVAGLSQCGSFVISMINIHDMTTEARDLEVPVTNKKLELQALCRCGINLLYHWVLNDINFISRLNYHEGFYQSFVASCMVMKDELELDETQASMLFDLEDTLPILADDVQTPSAARRDVWILRTFENFKISDRLC